MSLWDWGLQQGQIQVVDHCFAKEHWDRDGPLFERGPFQGYVEEHEDWGPKGKGMSGHCAVSGDLHRGYIVEGPLDEEPA